MSTTEAGGPNGFSRSMWAALDAVVVRAVTTSEFEDVCRLRYECYGREGSLPDDAPARFADRYDEEPNTTNYGVFEDGVLVAALRMHVFDSVAPTSPATTAFPDLIVPFLEAGERLVDGTRFVVDAEASRRQPLLAYVVTRICWMAGHHYDGDAIITTCRPEHMAFYRRFFRHRVLCDARPYPGLSKPQGLLRCDRRQEAAAVERRNPYLASTASERGALFVGGVVRGLEAAE